MSKKKAWTGRVFLGRDPSTGKQLFWWCGRHETKRARDEAVAKARTEKPWEAKTPDSMTCNEWADRYLARYERQNKASSLDTAARSLKAFRTAFGDRQMSDITHVEAEDWAQTVSPYAVPQAVAMFGYAKRMRVIEHNPFDGLGGGRGKGRSEQDPPTVKELEQLRQACSVLGEYGPQMRDLLDFAALTLLRPGELYALRFTDVDLVAHRITVTQRLYRGKLDVPKSGKAKTIALVPPAREILLRQPTRAREDGLVFVSKQGARLTASTVTQYWALVRAAAGIERDMPFYLASKHRGVSELYQLGLSARAIAAQAGWSEKAVDAMLAVYGHKDLIALAEVDALYAGPVERERMRK